MLKHMVAITALITGLPIFINQANAWNLICGVSINLAERETSRKWDADSSALYGVSHFYAAIAEMQRIELNDDHTFIDPVSRHSGKTAIDQAAYELKNSVDAFTKGLRIAQQYNLGDERGLSLLKDLVDETTNLYETIEYKRTLPNLTDVQDVTKKINDFTAHGIELSNEHLREGLRGHGMGGSEYKIPD